MAIVVLQHGEDGIGRLGPVLRDDGFSTDVRRLDLPPSKGGRGIPPDYDNVQGVISLGGHMNVADTAAHPWIEQEIAYLRGAHERQLPIVGICLGHQMLAKALGGDVAPASKPEWGFCRVTQTPPGNVDVMLAGQPWGTYQFQSHFQEVSKVPDGATVLASSKDCKVQILRAGLRSYGFQFHFEFTRAQIEGFTRDQTCQKEMAQAGLTPPDLLRQLEEHYDTFDRLATRQCQQIATLMFPSVSKLRV
jgi:GMP synthase (glutamine-hydrolysing)